MCTVDSTGRDYDCSIVAAFLVYCPGGRSDYGDTRVVVAFAGLASCILLWISSKINRRSDGFLTVEELIVNREAFFFFFSSIFRKSPAYYGRSVAARVHPAPPPRFLPTILSRLGSVFPPVPCRRSPDFCILALSRFAQIHGGIFSA